MTRQSLDQVTQIGVEGTKGSGSASTMYKLQSFGLMPSLQADVTSYRPKGWKYPTETVLGKDWTTASIDGDAYATYTELIFIFNSILESVTGSQIATSTAYEWIWNPNSSGADSVDTHAVESGDSNTAETWAYNLFTAFTLEATRDEVSISGDTLGQDLSKGGSLTGSPSTLELVPVQPGDISIYMDGTSANLGTTQLTRVLSYQYSISERFGPAWFLDASESSWSEETETEPTAQVTLKVEADSTGMGLVDTLRNGDRKFIRFLAEGADVDAGNLYTLQIDTALEVVDVNDFSDEDGVFAIEYTFDIIHDDTWGQAQQVKLINGVSSL